MPIAFNVNLYLADSTGRAVLLETLDGHKAYREISEGNEENYVCAANHCVLPEMIPYEPVGMKNSIVRYELQKNFLESKNQIDEYLT